MLSVLLCYIQNGSNLIEYPKNNVHQKKKLYKKVNIKQLSVVLVIKKVIESFI